MKIGVWCDYGTTLKPSEGIGVFVANLLRGLARLPAPPEVVLLVSPCDPGVHRLLLQYARGLSVSLLGNRGGYVVRLKVLLVGVLHRAGRFIGGLLAARSARAAGATRPPPPASAVGHFRRAWRAFCSIRYRRIMRQARRSNCDIWLLPHPDTPDVSQLGAPYVLLLFDMVYRHHADVFSPDRSAALFERTLQRARQASMCVCASDSIRRQDLLGELGLPVEKTAVIPLAPPGDPGFAQATDEAALRARHRLPRRFVFYPAAFRTYKGHALLLRAADRLRRQSGADIGVVFTGITTPPPYMLAEIAARGMDEHVRCLGDVSLPDLLALYRCADAMVFPPLHEGFGLPPVEALALGCPLVCADLPVLREPLGEFANDVAMFDPGSVDDLCRALVEVLGDRDKAVKRQANAARHVTRRTWVDVAGDWLALLNRAAHAPNPQGNV